MAIYDYDLKEILPKIQGPIREILEQDLALGNTIVEFSESWPLKGGNVWLAFGFQKDYSQEYPSLTYRFIGDPRQWLEEYADFDRGILIAVAGTGGYLSLEQARAATRKKF